MKAPAFQFYTGDWLKDPQLSMCSPATRGIWMDMLCAMHELGRSGQVTGTIEQLCRLCRCTAAEMSAALAEIISTDTATTNTRNGVVTVICRRMYREQKERISTNSRVRRHRYGEDETEVERQSNGASSSSPSSSVSTPKKEEERPAKKPRDERIDHPAMIAFREVRGRFPNKDVWDLVIKTVGEQPEVDRMRTCWLAWRGKGYAPENLAWLVDWYANGMPGNRANGDQRSPSKVDNSMAAVGRVLQEIECQDQTQK